MTKKRTLYIVSGDGELANLTEQATLYTDAVEAIKALAEESKNGGNAVLYRLDPILAAEDESLWVASGNKGVL